MPLAQAAEFSDVFAHFEIDDHQRAAESCYLYAPVFPAVVGGRRAVIKRTRSPERAAAALAGWTRRLHAKGVRVVAPLPLSVSNPARIGDRMWVVYPWLDGPRYDGSDAHIDAAGDLLGRIHAHGADADPDMPRFPWPDHDAASVDEDVVGLRRVLGAYVPQMAAPVLDRMAPWLESFMTRTLPAIRDADIPFVACSMDFKANNLVYAPGGPVLVDPDNAEYAPRILDLAMAALLFHNEDEGAPPRLFEPAEWEVFRAAYARHVQLTQTEYELWSTAVRYMILEWGTWTLIDADEWGDWADPRKRGFLVDLAGTNADRFRIK